MIYFSFSISKFVCTLPTLTISFSASVRSSMKPVHTESGKVVSDLSVGLPGMDFIMVVIALISAVIFTIPLPSAFSVISVVSRQPLSNSVEPLNRENIIFFIPVILFGDGIVQSVLLIPGWLYRNDFHSQKKIPGFFILHSFTKKTNMDVV